ncbi:MAG: acylphosphatase [Patescibacteria group bacterium]|mgnify:FL=1
MLKCLECKIFGRVQFVMFRDFVKRRADRLKLTGTVENKNDGSVFVIAEGEGKALEELISYLKKGPIFAKVLSIEPKWLESTGAFTDFKIIFYDREQ